MKIFFKLDEDEDEGVDPQDPVGNITITDGQTTLSVESTYLDSWFDVLIDGLNSLSINNKITLEIVEEPEVVIFENLGENFKITYGKKELLFSNLNEFYQALLISVKEFLFQLDKNKEKDLNFPIIVKIRNFIKQSSNKKLIDNTIKLG